MSGPRVFGLPHLSEDAVAAFADGVLSASATGRARRHCAECSECAAAVRIQREAAMLLRTAAAPALPSGLLDRLAGLPMSTPLPPPRGGLPTVLGADGTPVFVAHDVHRALAAAAEQSAPGHRSAGHPEGGPSDGRSVDGRSVGGRSVGGQGKHPDAKHPDGDSTDPTAGGPSRPAHRRGTLPATMLASAAAVVAAGTFGGHVSSLAASGDQPVPAGAAQVAGAFGGTRAASTTPSSGNLIGTGPVLATGLPAGRPSSQANAPAIPARSVVRPGVPLPAVVTVARVPRRPGSLAVLPALLAGYRPTAAGAPTATP
ncbi:MAG: hypothetical protein JO144_14645 [Actinobacteria bacterium]|nr:hypothetical protein [Actinomycetota bacterium]